MRFPPKSPRRGRRRAAAAMPSLASVAICSLFLATGIPPLQAADSPILDLSTFFGSSAADVINDVEADPGGNVVIVGRTHMFNPTDFPLLNAFQQADDHKLAPGMQAFVSRFSPTGELIFSTYLGGERNDEATAVAVDIAGGSYVTGYTQSNIDFGGFALAEFNGFPTTPGAYITNGAVRFDRCVFLTRFNPSGGVTYSTLVTRDGGSGSVGQSVAVDAAGNAYVAGTLDSTPMDLPGGMALFSGAFLMKFNPQGTGTLYTNLIPGGVGWDVAVEPDGTAHFVGRFSGSNLVTTPDAYDVPTGTGGGFYQKISPDGTVLYSTAYAPRNGLVRAVAVDPQGRAVIAGSVGQVFGPLFPGHFQPVHPIQGAFGGGDRDGFIARLDTRLSGSNVVDFATYLGGEEIDELTDIAIDDAGRIYAEGNTQSTNLTSAAEFPSRLAGGRDAFLVQLNAAATGIEFATHLGGKGWETARGITPLASPPGVALAGDTLSTNFPTTKAFQAIFRGSDTEGFLSKFNAATATETLVVNSDNDLDDGICDSAHCSLREAINSANTTPGAQVITFNILPPVPGTEAGPVIRPTSALPRIVGPVTIDGSTQPGGGWVALDGANAGPATHGLHLVDTTNCVIRGLALHSFRGDGIRIQAGGRHTLSDLHVGTDIVGTNRLGNQGAGIHIVASPNNTITGGTDLFRGTLISGNIGGGIRIEHDHSVSNRIVDVRVGLDGNTRPLGNGVAGIHLVNAHHTEITECIVSGNAETGIRLNGLDGARITRSAIGLWRVADPTTGVEQDPPVNGRVGLSLFDCTGVVVKDSPSLIADEIALSIERGTSNRVEGNLIGSGLPGNHAGRPYTGVRIVQSSRNLIGGPGSNPGTAPGNRFIGNGIAISLEGASAEGNILRGNRFGGPGNEANTTGILCAAPETVIGGDTTADANRFERHTGPAVQFESDVARGSSITGNRLVPAPSPVPGGITGIALSNTTDIRVGGPTTQPGQPPGNILGGYPTGIYLVKASSSLVQGNLVGALPGDPSLSSNHDGIELFGSKANRIGGDEPGTGNAIVGNTGHGISVRGDAQSTSEANRITGNFIGVAPDGVTPAPNQSDGIRFGMGALRNLVGISPNPAHGGRANIIAHNRGNGIYMDWVDGSITTPRHLISRNHIFDNGGLGISSATWPGVPKGEIRLVGTLPVAPDSSLRTTAVGILDEHEYNKVYRVEIYGNDACDPSGAGEGRRFLGAYEFLAKSRFQPVFVPLEAENVTDRFLTALLIDDQGNTSEFSHCFEIVPIADSDGDSIPDALEDAGMPDSNGDGTPDRQQPHVGRTHSPGSSQSVVVTGPTGGAFSDVRTPPVPAEPGQLPSGAHLPAGQIDFRFTAPRPHRDRKAPARPAS